ncbi:MAG: ABC transporter permease [Desulfobulbaceae bacterium]|nr:ABC transporter permease [Desulfobulbaceae bacterium]
MDITLSSFLTAIIIIAAPLILAALGETLTEKAGVVNLSLDGTLLLSAMTGFAIAYETNSLLLGFLGGAITGGAVALLLAIIGVWLGQSQVAVGFALTFLCRDLAYFLGTPYARKQGPQLEILQIPILADIPFIGPLFFSHTAVVYLSFIAIPCCTYFLYRTRRGLILRMAGENPEGCWARGVNPIKIRMLYTIAGGFIVGLGGAGFSLAVKPGWGHPQGCEGIGWIALALVIFGSWHPIRVVIGAYFFGLLQLLGIYFQDFFSGIPPQIFQVAPFPLMIGTLILIHLSNNTKNKQLSRWMRILNGRPPKWLGKVYHRS